MLESDRFWWVIFLHCIVWRFSHWCTWLILYLTRCPIPLWLSSIKFWLHSLPFNLFILDSFVLFWDDMVMFERVLNEFDLKLSKRRRAMANKTSILERFWSWFSIDLEDGRFLVGKRVLHYYWKTVDIEDVSLIKFYYAYGSIIF